jgi:hypothetical protein
VQPASQVVTMASTQESGEPQYCQFSMPVPGGAQWIRVSLGYRRSTDFDRTNQPGQDYAIVRGGYGSVVGVVADGVSQSFYGHLAAQFVAEQLLEFLWEWRETPPSTRQLNCVLRDFERQFKTGIDGYLLPAHLQPLQRAALEQTRDQAGSQAVFAAFVLNAEARSLRLFEVGDAVAVVHCARGDTNGSHSKVIQADRRGRWSSAGRADLRLEEVNEQDVKGVVIKSDGAKDWGASLARHKFNQAAFFEVASELAGYDDVSFVAAVFQNESSDYIPATPGTGFELNPSAPLVMGNPTGPQSGGRQPPTMPSPAALEQPFYNPGEQPAKKRRAWAAFALGLGAGFLLAAIGLLGLLRGEVIMLKPNAPVTVKPAETPSDSNVLPNARCVYQLEPESEDFDASGGEGRFKIKTGADCAWEVSPEQDWIKITKKSADIGDGEVAYTIKPSRSSDREGVIRIVAKSFKITQKTAERKPSKKTAVSRAPAKEARTPNPSGTSQGRRQPEENN